MKQVKIKVVNHWLTAHSKKLFSLKILQFNSYDAKLHSAYELVIINFGFILTVDKKHDNRRNA